MLNPLNKRSAQLDGQNATASRETLTTIEPRQRGVVERFREVWRHRSLYRFFAQRARDKLIARTVLGSTWLVMRPFLDVSAKALVFGGLLGAPSGGVPYFIFFLAGMAAWRLFDNSVIWSTRSLELNRNLLKRIYFPHLLLPVASLSPALIEFGVYVFLIVVSVTAFSLMDGTLYVNLGLNLLAAAAALGLCLTFAVGLGLWLSVPGAGARDVRFSMRYVTEFWMFMTPVIYPLSAVPAPWRTLAQVNPMTPVIELFKSGLIGVGQVEPVSLAASVAVIFGVFGSGLWFFSRAEAAVVDAL